MTNISGSPLFSVVTVTKDNLQGLRATQESLLTQSFRDYEWIIIDGDSLDGTKEHIAALPAHSISEPDKGIYDAMNKGIERSKGQHLIFMNAGDRFSDPDILSSIAKAIAAEYPDFIYGDALETGGFYKKARSHAKINWGMFTHHQAMLYRRDKIGNLRYNQHMKIAADYDFTARFLKQADKIHYIPAAICIFETGGVSQQNMQKGRIEQFHARKKLGLNLVKNGAVYIGQTAAASFKKGAPKVYAAFKATHL
jgi:putative colanic acid biosynthesis glycosyltransferase